MDELDELGPVDYLVVEFPPDTANFTGEMAAELAALAEAGTIRILDVLILYKGDDGEVEAFEIDDLAEFVAHRRRLADNNGQLVEQVGIHASAPPDSQKRSAKLAATCLMYC